MIVKGTIGFLRDEKTKYEFDFENQTVIQSDDHDNVLVYSFAEWNILMLRWVEAYKEYLRS